MSIRWSFKHNWNVVRVTVRRRSLFLRFWWLGFYVELTELWNGTEDHLTWLRRARQHRSIFRSWRDWRQHR